MQHSKVVFLAKFIKLIANKFGLAFWFCSIAKKNTNALITLAIGKAIRYSHPLVNSIKKSNPCHRVLF
jgi:hypothetical protein